MKAIDQIADKHNLLLVIEDRAKATGAAGDGFKAAEFSHAGAVATNNVRSPFAAFSAITLRLGQEA